MVIKGSFQVDVFDCNVYILVGDSIRNSINYHLRKCGTGEIDFDPSAFFCNPDLSKIGKYYLFFDVDDLSVDIVNHEKSHLVEQILTDRDIKPVDEIRSYLDGFLSRKIHMFFKNRKIKLKDKR